MRKSKWKLKFESNPNPYIDRTHIGYIIFSKEVMRLHPIL